MVQTLLENPLWHHARITEHADKTKIWNQACVKPEACDFLEHRARLARVRFRRSFIREVCCCDFEERELLYVWQM